MADNLNAFLTGESDTNPLGSADLDSFLTGRTDTNPLTGKSIGLAGEKKKEPRLGMLGALASGVEGAANRVGASFDVYTGDDEELIQGTREAAQIQKTPEQRAFTASLQAEEANDEEDTLLGAIENVYRATVDNPTGAFHTLLEQLPNSAVVIGSMVGGAKAGAAAGTLVAPGAGTVVGGIVGGITGLFVGNNAVETGAIAQQKVGEGNYDRGETIRQGATKSAVITAIDTATLGFARALGGAPSKAAGSAIVDMLKKQGINAADDIAVAAAIRANPALLKAMRETGEKAFIAATPTGVKGVGVNAAAGTLDMLGEGAGEYLGSTAAGLDASLTEAVLESVMSIPQSGAEVAIGKLFGRNAGKRDVDQMTAGYARALVDPLKQADIADTVVQTRDKELTKLRKEYTAAMKNGGDADLAAEFEQRIEGAEKNAKLARDHATRVKTGREPVVEEWTGGEAQTHGIQPMTQPTATVGGEGYDNRADLGYQIEGQRRRQDAQGTEQASGDVIEVSADGTAFDGGLDDAGRRGLDAQRQAESAESDRKVMDALSSWGKRTAPTAAGGMLGMPSTAMTLPVKNVTEQEEILPAEPVAEPAAEPIAEPIAEKPAERPKPKRTYNPDVHSLKQAIGFMGGISRDAALAIGVDPAHFKDSRKGMPFGTSFISKNGRSIGELFEMASQQGVGYVKTQEELVEKIFDALGGTDHYTPTGLTRQAELQAQEQERFEQQVEPITPEVSNEEAILAAVSQEAIDAGVAPGIIKNIIKRNDGGNELVAAMEVRNEIEALQAQGLPSQGSAPGTVSQNEDEFADFDFDGGQAASEEDIFGEAEPELLTSYTESDLQRRQDAEEARQQDSEATARDAENKAKADAEVGSFTMAGSDREADVAAAHEQNDLLAAPAEEDSPPGGKTAQPDGYGKNNTLVSADRAAELRAKLKAKLSQLNSGIDPEMIAIGTELAVYHIEAGTRKFIDFARTMAKDLGTDIKTIKPYLRSWYNGARDMMEDSGLAVDDMNTADQVRQVLPTLNDGILSEDKNNESLADALYRQIDGITDNRQLKTAVADHKGVPVSEVDAELMKEAQEAMELAIVKKARDIVAEGRSDQATYQSLVSLYKAQPNLNMRSSTSMANQAYSTPAPIAFLASRLAGIDGNTSVYEPTAGNGMLLIGADPKNTTANELNDLRADQLRAQGFTVTQHDATDFVPGSPVDSAIMNPPFGRLDKQVKHDGYTIKAIDHLITAKALEAIKDDGKGVIIIGASKEAGGISPSDRTFFNWLYSNYNVTDHFEINGDLYKRQGAGWPIRVIVVNGRESSSNISPVSGSIERLNEWDEIYERYQESLDATAERDSERAGATGAHGTGQPGRQDGSGSAEDAAGRKAGATDSGGRGQRRTRGFNPGDRTGHGLHGSTSQQSEGHSAEPAVGRQPKRADGQDRLPGEAKAATGRNQATETADAAKPDGGSSQRDGVSSSEFQATYNTRSSGFNEAVLTPVNMAGATESALSELEKAVGNIDEYVMSKLGYKDLAELHKAFMGLQVDTIAAAIYNIENKGKGIIIADQTGVGKGRQAAGIIRYALRQGKTPVFVTLKDNLFTDMFNDLRDIGEERVQPLIMNQTAVIKDGDQQLFKNPGRKTHVATLTDITASKELPAGRNALFMTYSQINTPNLQRKVLEALKDDAIFVLDEAHNAAGEREMVKKVNGETVKQMTGAGFMYQMLDSAPVVYLSATFAKRPDNMPIYYRTDLMDAVDTANELVDAVASGGVPLQTVLSGMLAESGQLFRRERSFEGISIPTVIDTEHGAEHAAIADKVTEGLRAVVSADWQFHNVFMEEYASQIQLEGGDAFGAGNKASSSVDHSNFTSVIHNYISQLLMGLKAKKAVADAIELHKQGIKPVFALSSTMGSFLDDYVDTMGLKKGDVVDADYRDVLHKALDRTRRVTIKLPNGSDEKREITLDMLDPGTRQAYRDAEKVIDNLVIDDLPMSPIDYVRDELAKQGIRVSEITGRTLRIDYSSGEPILAARDSKERNDKRATVDAFNNGDIDGLVLNSAGSTGLSIHASERFKDQSPRHMLVMQADADINVLMQMLGRINRTGQVELPGYSMMGLDIPAEKRPLARTAFKMKSLNANTSANADSDTSIDAADIMNKYGDQVVNDYLLNDPEMGDMLGLVADEKAATAGLALKFTGRLALMPVDVQREVYEDIEAGYVSLIDFLNKTGQNDLEAHTIDLDARIIESKVAYEGKAPETRFGGHTFIHKVNAKYQGKPPQPEEVKTAIEEGLGGKTPQQITDAILDLKERDARHHEELKARAKKTADALAAMERDGQADKKKLQEAAGESSRAEEKLEQYDQQRSGTAHLLKFYQVGRRFRLDLGDDVVTAVVVSVKDAHKEGKGSPWSPSKTRVSFMVNSGIRSIELPLSKLQIDGGIYVEQLRESGTEGLETIFSPDLVSSDKREIRYVATGNLIAGSAKLQGGRIVNFTDNQGGTHQGILMPKKYGKNGEFAGAGSAQNFPIRDQGVLLKFLKKNRGELERLDGIFSANGAVRLMPLPNGGWKIRVPRANKDQTAKSVKFDQGLIAAMGGDFYGSGKNMEARFNESRLDSVAGTLLDLTPMYGLPSMREAWVDAGGQAVAEAESRFSIEAKPGAHVSTADAQQVIDRISKAWKGIDRGDITLVDTFSELPEQVQQDARQSGAEGKVRGAFHKGKVYLVADQLRNDAEVEQVLLHEALGHYGLQKLFGKDIRQAMNRLFLGIGGAKGLIDIARANGIDIGAYARGLIGSDKSGMSDKDLIADRDIRNSILMEELLAHIAQDSRPSVKRMVKELIGKLRAWLRAHGFLKTAKVSDAELFALLKQARDQVTSKPGKGGGDGTRFMVGLMDALRHEEQLNENSAHDISVEEVGHSSIVITDRNNPGIILTTEGFRPEDGEHVGAYLEVTGDASELGGKGTSTRLYLEGLKIAKADGYGWRSDSILSDESHAMYDRLIKLGFPFKRKGRGQALYLSPEELAKIDVDQIIIDLNSKHADNSTQGESVSEFDTKTTYYHASKAAFEGGRNAAEAKQYGIDVAASFNEARGGIYFSTDGGLVESIFAGSTFATEADEYQLSKGRSFDAQWLSMGDDDKAMLRSIIDGVVDESDTEDARTKLEITDPDWDAFEAFTDGEFYLSFGRNLQNQVIEGIFAAGFDSVVFPDSLTWGDEHVSTVVKSAGQIRPAPAAANEISPAMFSRTSEAFSDLTEAQANILDHKIGPETLPKRLKHRFEELRENMGLKIRQGLVDKFAALKAMDIKLYGTDAIADHTAASSWVLARMTSAADGALNALINYGRIKMDGGVIDVDPNTESLHDVLKGLGSSAEIERFMGWIAMNRAQKLEAEGRENLFTSDEIAEGVLLNQGTTDDGADRARLYDEVFAKFQVLRDDVLAIADQSGLLQKAMSEDDALYVIAKNNGTEMPLARKVRKLAKKLASGDYDDIDMIEASYGEALAKLRESLESSVDGFEDEFELLTTDQRDLWANEFYVPFYRIIEDEGDTKGPRATGGISRQQAYKKLKGGDQSLNDLLENTLMNFQHLLSASLKNQAARQAITNATQLNIATPTSESRRDKNASTFILEDGEKTWYNISDALVYQALTSMTDIGMNGTAMKAMRAFKRTLTNFTTASPQYMAANLIRDSFQSVALADMKKNPIANAVKGAMAYGVLDKNTATRAHMIATGGAFTYGQAYGEDANSMKAEINRELHKGGLIKDSSDVLGLLRKGWDWYHGISDSLENANRATVYEKALADGKTKLQAAFAARDLMDFGAHGSWPAIRFLTGVVPFLNSRLQGLDKIYRSGVKPTASVVRQLFPGAKGVSDSDRKAAARFSAVTGALALATMALYLANQDDDDYKALEDWQKDTYWFFKVGGNGFFVPKPFEVGAIATLAERSLEQIVDDKATGKLFADRIGHMLMDTFSFSPVPQMFAPAVDIYSNRDSFTGRPIESMGMQRLSPENRVRTNTTGLAKLVSQATVSTAGAVFGKDSKLVLSPVQIDYLVGGYLGWLGERGMAVTDVITKTLDGETAPAKAWYEHQPFRRFYRDLDLPGYTKYQTQFYDDLREVGRIQADIVNFRKLGEYEEALDLATENRDKLRWRKHMNRVQKKLTTVNAQMKMVRRSNASADDKRRRIDALQLQKNKLTELASSRYRG